jgi:putative GTP pyrophosphokinase
VSERQNGLSNAQLDKLGDRLRAGSASQADLHALDDYRRSFRDSYDYIVDAIKTRGGLEGTGRPAKTTSAIIDKLRRQHIRLSQIQDISGFRVIVDGIIEQDRVVQSLREMFPAASVDDRRASPSYGYRAVHVIASAHNRLVEIQVRTREQHLWAELSEKLSDVVDRAVKYGGGPDSTRASLLNYSQLLSKIEAFELAMGRGTVELIEQMSARAPLDPQDPGFAGIVEVLDKLKALQLSGEEKARELKRELADFLIRDYNELTGRS